MVSTAGGNVFRSSGILAAQMVPADGEHLEEHAQAVFQRVDLGALVVRPLDGDFSDAQSKPVRQEEQFGIEAPAFDTLTRKNLLRRPAGERLEAALRVFEAQSQEKPQQQVEDAPEELAVERLTFGLQLALQPARPDGHVGAVRQSGE